MNRFALMRYERGMTQQELSDASGIKLRTVRSLEVGDPRPSAPIAKALADFYKVPITEILGLDGEGQEAA